MSGRRRSYEGALTGVKFLVEEQAKRRQSQHEFGQKIALQDRQFAQQRAMQDDRQIFEERLRKAIANEATNRAITVQSMRQSRPPSPQDQLRQQQLGMAELQSPLPEGGFRREELADPAMMRTQVQPMLQRRQQALQDVGLIRPPAGQQPVDPLVQANRVAQIQQRIQDMEMANQLGPIMAESERQKSASPGWFGTPIGRRMPPPVDVERQDTSYLRGVVQPYLGGTSPTSTQAGPGLPSDLPDPSQYQEGQVIENDQGQRMRLVRGWWMPQN